MGSSSRTTILDRLLEMLRGKGSISNPRPEKGSRKAAERDQSKIASKAGKKRKKAA